LESLSESKAKKTLDGNEYCKARAPERDRLLSTASSLDASTTDEVGSSAGSAGLHSIASTSSLTSPLTATSPRLLYGRDRALSPNIARRTLSPSINRGPSPTINQQRCNAHTSPSRSCYAHIQPANALPKHSPSRSCYAHVPLCRQASPPPRVHVSPAPASRDALLPKVTVNALGGRRPVSCTIGVQQTITITNTVHVTLEVA
jgi:hypothetical protein